MQWHSSHSCVASMLIDQSLLPLAAFLRLLAPQALGTQLSCTQKYASTWALLQQCYVCNRLAQLTCTPAAAPINLGRSSEAPTTALGPCKLVQAWVSIGQSACEGAAESAATRLSDLTIASAKALGGTLIICSSKAESATN